MQNSCEIPGPKPLVLVAYLGTKFDRSACAIERDDNSKVFTFYADDWASAETLGELIKSAATTTEYERFSADGALAVYDPDGTAVARTDGRSGWALPDHGLGRRGRLENR